MEWKEIKSFLEKASRLIKGDTLVKGSVVAAVKNIIGAEIDPKDVVLKGSKLVVRAHPVLRSEIQLRKKEILESVNKNYPSIKITDIY